jgi:hypothetical protein
MAAGIRASHRPPSDPKLFCGRRTGIELHGVHGQATGSGRGIDQHESVGIGPGHSPRVDDHAGGGLVVRGAVGIDPGLCSEDRRIAGLGADDGRIAEVGSLPDALGELRAELPEGEHLGAGRE